MTTIEKFKHHFYYNDGKLFWKNPTNLHHNIGDVAGGIRKDGYSHVCLYGKYYLVHRVIYSLFYNKLPDFIDHINGNKEDNRIENLRECSHNQNMYNKKIYSNNTSGIKGINFNAKRNAWVVRICHNNKRLFLGYYDDLNTAISILQNARDKYHGEFCKY